jgi:hypothetical protein
MLYRIVGLDPGLTTGLVTFTINDENNIGCVNSYQLDLVGVGRYLRDRIWPESIVCYEFANKFQASGHVSSEVIGLIKYYCELNHVKPIGVTQSAHKKLITKDVLKRARLDVKGDHAQDAARVALFHSVTKLGLGKCYLGQGDDHGYQEDYEA